MQKIKSLKELKNLTPTLKSSGKNSFMPWCF